MNWQDVQQYTELYQWQLIQPCQQGKHEWLPAMMHEIMQAMGALTMQDTNKQARQLQAS